MSEAGMQERKTETSDGRGGGVAVAVLLAVLTGCVGGVTGEPATTTFGGVTSEPTRTEATTTTEATATTEATNTSECEVVHG